MLELLADRKFVVRRGRNNRILAKAIVKNVFEDTQVEVETSDKQINRSNRGQNHYLSKYEKLWSAQRKDDDLYKFEPVRKRARKSSVFDTCLEDLPESFKDYAIQRSMVYKRGLRKLGEIPSSEFIGGGDPREE
jgi:hypothetical protein